MEAVIGGGRLRERALHTALAAHYRSRHRRDWLWATEPPHFYPQRWTAYAATQTQPSPGPYALARGFFTAELIRDGDAVLDIGCGDGYYAAQFYATRAGQVDAIDVDEDAIRFARQDNPHPRVAYWLRDAVAEPFPQEAYDVIAWDGAIGHFAPDAAAHVLRKAAGALKPGGVFAGSESLGRVADTDHLQHFDTTADLARALGEAFAIVQIRTLEYPASGSARREGFWRCAATETDRLRAASWRDVPEA